MPKAPGVYHQKISSGNKPIVSISPSTFGVLVYSDFGVPNTPKTITSLAQYEFWFGGNRADSWSWWAIKSLMEYGGCRYAKVSRFIGANSVKATKTTLIATGKNLILTLRHPGVEGNNISVKFEKMGGAKSERLVMDVFYTKNGVIQRKERISDINADPAADDDIIGKITAQSEWLDASYDVTPTKVEVLAWVTNDGVTVTLAGGSDGDAFNETTIIPASNDGTGIYAFDLHTDIRNILVPDDINVTTPKTVRDAVISYCNAKKYLFYFMSAELGNTPDEAKAEKEDYDCEYAAYYWPWIKVFDPFARIEKLVPPAGFAGGAACIVDGGEEGVHKAPANIALNGALGVEYEVTEAEHEMLNNAGVNCTIRDRGIRIMGGRTTSTDPEWRYIHIVRTFNMFWTSIIANMRWAIFEVNDSKLWGRIRRNTTAYFKKFDRREVRNGALWNKNNPDEDPYYVICDASTNIEDTRVVCRYGLCIVDTAEVIEFESSLWDGGWSMNLVE